MSNANAAEHHVQMQPPIIRAHVGWPLERHGRSIHAQALRCLDSADSLWDQRDLVPGHLALGGQAEAINGFVRNELPVGLVHRNLHHARPKAHVLVELVELHEHAARRVAKPVIPRCVRLVSRIGAPVRDPRFELLRVKLHTHHLPCCVLHYSMLP